MTTIRTLLLFLITLSTMPAWAGSAEISIAAAADLSSVLPELAANYQKQTGTMVRLSFGSSGNLTQQIKNGAPFDLFFSADEDYPKQLVQAGLAESSSLQRYARGQLVLWVPAESPLDTQHRGLEALLDPSVQKVAIANPQHAPYGRAAEAALKRAQLYEKIASKLVLGENVSQAAQFVESGNAQAGLIALSHALAPGIKDKGRYWVIPADSYPELNQAAVVLTRSQHKKEAAGFLDYLKSSEPRAVLQRFGFSLPGEAR
jgi:molybdate transport system substrate-binding protein